MSNSDETRRAAVLIRLLLAAVFIPEGLKKFLFPAQWGAGRFTRIGLPAPEFLAHFVGAVELGCGILLLLGLFAQLAAIPLVIDMLVALATTKIPLLWRATAVSTKVGFWSFQAESRTDLAMLLAALFVAVAGAGAWSLDARRRKPRARERQTGA